MGDRRRSRGAPRRPSPVLESQRTLVYAAAAFAAILIVRVGYLPGAARGGLGGDRAHLRLQPADAAVSRAARDSPTRSPGTARGAARVLERARDLRGDRDAPCRGVRGPRPQHPVSGARCRLDSRSWCRLLYFTFSRGGWLALGGLADRDGRRSTSGGCSSITTLRRRCALAGARRLARLAIAPLTHVGGADRAPPSTPADHFTVYLAAWRSPPAR